MDAGESTVLQDVYSAIDIAYTKGTGGAIIGQRVGYEIAEAAIEATIEGLAADPDAVKRVGNAFMRSLALQRKAMAVATIMPETAMAAARAAIMALCGEAIDDEWRLSSANEPTELWPGGPLVTFHDANGHPMAREFRIVEQRLELRDPAPTRFYVDDRTKQPGEYVAAGDQMIQHSKPLREYKPLQVSMEDSDGDSGPSHSD